MDSVDAWASIDAHSGLFALLAEESLHSELILESHDFLVAGGARNAPNPVNVILCTVILTSEKASNVLRYVAHNVVIISMTLLREESAEVDGLLRRE